MAVAASAGASPARPAGAVRRSRCTTCMSPGAGCSGWRRSPGSSCSARSWARCSWASSSCRTCSGTRRWSRGRPSCRRPCSWCWLHRGRPGSSAATAPGSPCWPVTSRACSALPSCCCYGVREAVTGRWGWRTRWSASAWAWQAHLRRTRSPARCPLPGPVWRPAPLTCNATSVARSCSRCSVRCWQPATRRRSVSPSPARRTRRRSPAASRTSLRSPSPGATQVAQRYPQYASKIVAAAKSAFLAGDQWAYTAGIVAVLLGAVVVFFLFPGKEAEERLLARYHAEDQPHDAHGAVHKQS
jgi:hypothetical protein